MDRLTVLVGPWIAAAAAVVLVFAVLGAAMAQGAELEFANAAEEARFRRLASELRCLVCQNQSLEDSNAPLAFDLKKEVQMQMRKGATDDEIVAYLIARYGDFVRYRPPVRPGTWPLWFGPAALLLAGGYVLWRVVRRQGGPPPVAQVPQAAQSASAAAGGRRAR